MHTASHHSFSFVYRFLRDIRRSLLVMVICFSLICAVNVFLLFLTHSASSTTSPCFSDGDCESTIEKCVFGSWKGLGKCRVKLQAVKNLQPEVVRQTKTRSILLSRRLTRQKRSSVHVWRGRRPPELHLRASQSHGQPEQDVSLQLVRATESRSPFDRIVADLLTKGWSAVSYNGVNVSVSLWPVRNTKADWMVVVARDNMTRNSALIQQRPRRGHVLSHMTSTDDVNGEQTRVAMTAVSLQKHLSQSDIRNKSSVHGRAMPADKHVRFRRALMAGDSVLDSIDPLINELSVVSPVIPDAEDIIVRSVSKRSSDLSQRARRELEEIEDEVKPLPKIIPSVEDGPIVIEDMFASSKSVPNLRRKRSRKQKRKAAQSRSSIKTKRDRHSHRSHAKTAALLARFWEEEGDRGSEENQEIIDAALDNFERKRRHHTKSMRKKKASKKDATKSHSAKVSETKSSAQIDEPTDVKRGASSSETDVSMTVEEHKAPPAGTSTTTETDEDSTATARTTTVADPFLKYEAKTEAIDYYDVSKRHSDEAIEDFDPEESIQTADDIAEEEDINVIDSTETRKKRQSFAEVTEDEQGVEDIPSWKRTVELLQKANTFAVPAHDRDGHVILVRRVRDLGMLDIGATLAKLRETMAKVFGRCSPAKRRRKRSRRMPSAVRSEIVRDILENEETWEIQGEKGETMAAAKVNVDMEEDKPYNVTTVLRPMGKRDSSVKNKNSHREKKKHTPSSHAMLRNARRLKRARILTRGAPRKHLAKDVSEFENILENIKSARSLLMPHERHTDLALKREDYDIPSNKPVKYKVPADSNIGLKIAMNQPQHGKPIVSTKFSSDKGAQGPLKRYFKTKPIRQPDSRGKSCIGDSCKRGLKSAGDIQKKPAKQEKTPCFGAECKGNSKDLAAKRQPATVNGKKSCINGMCKHISNDPAMKRQQSNKAHVEKCVGTKCTANAKDWESNGLYYDIPRDKKDRGPAGAHSGLKLYMDQPSPIGKQQVSTKLSSDKGAKGPMEKRTKLTRGRQRSGQIGGSCIGCERDIKHQNNQQASKKVVREPYAITRRYNASKTRTLRDAPRVRRARELVEEDTKETNRLLYIANGDLLPDTKVLTNAKRDVDVAAEIKIETSGTTVVSPTSTTMEPPSTQHKEDEEDVFGGDKTVVEEKIVTSKQKPKQNSVLLMEDKPPVISSNKNMEASIFSTDDGSALVMPDSELERSVTSSSSHLMSLISDLERALRVPLDDPGGDITILDGDSRSTDSDGAVFTIGSSGGNNPLEATATLQLDRDKPEPRDVTSVTHTKFAPLAIPVKNTVQTWPAVLSPALPGIQTVRYVLPKKKPVSEVNENIYLKGFDSIPRPLKPFYVDSVASKMSQIQPSYKAVVSAASDPVIKPGYLQLYDYPPKTSIVEQTNVEADAGEIRQETVETIQQHPMVGQIAIAPAAVSVVKPAPVVGVQGNLAVSGQLVAGIEPAPPAPPDNGKDTMVKVVSSLVSGDAANKGKVYPPQTVMVQTGDVSAPLVKTFSGGRIIATIGDNGQIIKKKDVGKATSDAERQPVVASDNLNRIRKPEETNAKRSLLPGNSGAKLYRVPQMSPGVAVKRAGGSGTDNLSASPNAVPETSVHTYSKDPGVQGATATMLKDLASRLTQQNTNKRNQAIVKQRSAPCVRSSTGQCFTSRVSPVNRQISRVHKRKVKRHELARREHFPKATVRKTKRDVAPSIFELRKTYLHNPKEVFEAPGSRYNFPEELVRDQRSFSFGDENREVQQILYVQSERKGRPPSDGTPTKRPNDIIIEVESLSTTTEPGKDAEDGPNIQQMIVFGPNVFKNVKLSDSVGTDSSELVKASVSNSVDFQRPEEKATTETPRIVYIEVRADNSSGTVTTQNPRDTFIEVNSSSVTEEHDRALKEASAHRRFKVLDPQDVFLSRQLRFDMRVDGAGNVIQEEKDLPMAVFPENSETFPQSQADSSMVVLRTKLEQQAHKSGQNAPGVGLVYTGNAPKQAMIPGSKSRGIVLSWPRVAGSKSQETIVSRPLRSVDEIHARRQPVSRNENLPKYGDLEEQKDTLKRELRNLNKIGKKAGLDLFDEKSIDRIVESEAKRAVHHKSKRAPSQPQNKAKWRRLMERSWKKRQKLEKQLRKTKEAQAQAAAHSKLSDILKAEGTRDYQTIANALVPSEDVKAKRNLDDDIESVLESQSLHQDDIISKRPKRKRKVKHRKSRSSLPENVGQIEISDFQPSYKVKDKVPNARLVQVINPEQYALSNDRDREERVVFDNIMGEPMQVSAVLRGRRRKRMAGDSLTQGEDVLSSFPNILPAIQAAEPIYEYHSDSVPQSLYNFQPNRKFIRSSLGPAAKGNLPQNKIQPSVWNRRPHHFPKSSLSSKVNDIGSSVQELAPNRLEDTMKRRQQMLNALGSVRKGNQQPNTMHRTSMLPLKKPHSSVSESTSRDSFPASQRGPTLNGLLGKAGPKHTFRNTTRVVAKPEPLMTTPKPASSGESVWKRLGEIFDVIPNEGGDRRLAASTAAVGASSSQSPLQEMVPDDAAIHLASSAVAKDARIQPRPDDAADTKETRHKSGLRTAIVDRLLHDLRKMSYARGSEMARAESDLVEILHDYQTDLMDEDEQTVAGEPFHGVRIHDNVAIPVVYQAVPIKLEGLSQQHHIVVRDSQPASASARRHFSRHLGQYAFIPP